MAGYPAQPYKIYETTTIMFIRSKSSKKEKEEKEREKEIKIDRREKGKV